MLSHRSFVKWNTKYVDKNKYRRVSVNMTVRQREDCIKKSLMLLEIYLESSKQYMEHFFAKIILQINNK